VIRERTTSRCLRKQFPWFVCGFLALLMLGLPRPARPQQVSEEAPQSLPSPVLEQVRPPKRHLDLSGAQRCRQDSDCPRPFICNGKYGVTDTETGECPQFYVCPGDPKLARPGICVFMGGNCESDADCPAYSHCAPTIEGAAWPGECHADPPPSNWRRGHTSAGR